VLAEKWRNRDALGLAGLANCPRRDEGDAVPA
jgi:hypothetical protein